MSKRATARSEFKKWYFRAYPWMQDTDLAYLIREGHVPEWAAFKSGWRAGRRAQTVAAEASK